MSTLSGSFRFLGDTKTLNAFILEAKTRAQRARVISASPKPRPKELLRLDLDVSDADRLDK